MKPKKSLTTLFIILIALLYVYEAFAGVLVGPTITVVSNSTMTEASSTMVNGTHNSTEEAGGYIFVINLNSDQKNDRWKAFRPFQISWFDRTLNTIGYSQ